MGLNSIFGKVTSKLAQEIAVNARKVTGNSKSIDKAIYIYVYVSICETYLNLHLYPFALTCLPANVKL